MSPEQVAAARPDRLGLPVSKDQHFEHIARKYLIDNVGDPSNLAVFCLPGVAVYCSTEGLPYKVYYILRWNPALDFYQDFVLDSFTTERGGYEQIGAPDFWTLNIHGTNYSSPVKAPHALAKFDIEALGEIVHKYQETFIWDDQPAYDILITYGEFKAHKLKPESKKEDPKPDVLEEVIHLALEYRARAIGDALREIDKIEKIVASIKSRYAGQTELNIPHHMTSDLRRSVDSLEFNVTQADAIHSTTVIMKSKKAR